MSVPSLKLLVLMLLGAALFPGCSSGLGDFCFQDSDCFSGLRCTALEDQRGVCTYPEGVPDQSMAADLGRDAPADRGPALDLGPADVGADLADGPRPLDQGAPDQALDLSLTPDQSADGPREDLGLDASADSAGDLALDAASGDSSPD